MMIMILMMMMMTIIDDDDNDGARGMISFRDIFTVTPGYI